MSVNHPNFYENVQEASMRLRKTVVLYDGEPYYVMAVSDHKNDGKLRIYLDKMGYQGIGRNRNQWLPPYQDMHQSEVGAVLDDWIQDNPQSGVIRKYLGASGFNKFRPFPLGNMNSQGQVIYVERTPTRNTFQGLRQEALIGQIVSVAPNRIDSNKNRKQVYTNSSYNRQNIVGVDMFEPEFYDCIMGNYPSFGEVVVALQDPDVTNTGCAFHRDFSVLRGPLNMLFLCYRTEGVGVITYPGNLSKHALTLSSDFSYLKETLEELDIFAYISVKE